MFKLYEAPSEQERLLRCPHPGWLTEHEIDALAARIAEVVREAHDLPKTADSCIVEALLRASVSLVGWQATLRAVLGMAR